MKKLFLVLVLASVSFGLMAREFNKLSVVEKKALVSEVWGARVAADEDKFIGKVSGAFGRTKLTFDEKAAREFYRGHAGRLTEVTREKFLTDFGQRLKLEDGWYRVSGDVTTR